MMKKGLVAAAAAVMMLSGCFQLTEDDMVYYMLGTSTEYKESNTIQNDPPQTVTALGITLEREMVENFDDDDIYDLRENWDLQEGDGVRRGAFWSDNALEQRDGYVSIHTKMVPFSELDLELTDEIKDHHGIESADEEVVISGALKTITKDGDTPMVYGLYVGRLKLDKETDGHWHAFWGYSTFAPVDGFDHTVGYEFDVFEYHRMGIGYPDNTDVDQTTHYNYGEKRHPFTHFQNIEKVSEWNTYAVLWTPEEYVYYVNWVPTYYVRLTAEGKMGGDLTAVKKRRIESTGNKVIPDLPMDFFFSTEVAKGIAWAEAWSGFLDESKLPDSLDVDYFAWYTCDEWKAAAAE